MNQEHISILLVDDEERIRETFGEILILNGFAVVPAEDGKAAVSAFCKERPSVVLLDMNLPDRSGMDVLREMQRIDRSVPIIFVTAYGDIPSAVDAIKEGAYDFIAKPPDFDRLLLTIRRAMEKRQLEQAVTDLSAAYRTSLESMLGASASMQPVIRQLKDIAVSDYSVILQGETGTGKTYLATIIHNLSRRATGPFVKVSIGSIPDTLAESELFGYERGAFTGAERTKKGYFEIACGGTIFLDDMDNITPFVQAKLLSVVEDRRIYHIGSTEPIKTDIRVVSAANRDLSSAVVSGGFRSDLLFRLSEFVLHIPPLRERLDDIAFFSRTFLIEACSELAKPVGELTPAALDVLKSYSWPGNLRQLRNILRRVVLLGFDGTVKADTLRLVLDLEDQTRKQGAHQAGSMKEAEKHAIIRALEQTDGKRTKAAELLQIDYKTLLRKIKEFHL